MLDRAKFAVAWLVMLAPLLVQAQGGYPRPRRDVASTTPANVSAYKDVAGSFHGKLKDLSGKEIMIETDDNQIVSIRRSRKTKFLKGTRPIKPSDIDIEALVTVDATEDVDLKLTAINVTVDQAKTSTDSK
jgi:hypothetical protein